MDNSKSNVVLIGMPGSGKSTVGVILAKLMGKSYLDTDVLIQTTHGKTLQEIVDKDGHMALRKIEEEVLLSVNCTDHIIATGGSAAYSDKAMNHLMNNGVVVFLHADLPTLRHRIKNFDTRGLAKKPDQSFEDLFQERFNLYRKYADIQIESSGFSQEDVCFDIMHYFVENQP